MEYLEMNSINEVLERITDINEIEINKEILRKFIRNSGYMSEYDYIINIHFSSKVNVIYNSINIYRAIIKIKEILLINNIINIEDLTIILDDNLYNILRNDKILYDALLLNNNTLCGIKVNMANGIVNKKYIAFSNIYTCISGLDLEIKKELLKAFDISIINIENFRKKSVNSISNVWIEKTNNKKEK